jgi:hypothetical protein
MLGYNEHDRMQDAQTGCQIGSLSPETGTKTVTKQPANRPAASGVFVLALLALHNRYKIARAAGKGQECQQTTPASAACAVRSLLLQAGAPNNTLKHATQIASPHF